MLRKSFFLSVFLSLFMIPQPVLAQQPKSNGQNAFRPGPGFPGFPGTAPKGKRWVPGHYEVKNGKQVWVPGGHKEADNNTQAASPIVPPWFKNKTPGDTEPAPADNKKVDEKTPAASPISPPWFNPNKRGDTEPAPPKEGFVRPFVKGREGESKGWIPGRFEKVDGKDTWIRGHGVGEKGTAGGPPKGIPDSPATEQAVSEKLQEPVSTAKAQGWAIVIGISDYQYAAGKFPELRYADRDAKDFYDFLRSPQGGGFPPERILFLENERATLDNIKYAFFDFLKQAIEEDYVVIYFSGHGTPEESNLENLYLMAYDSKPDRLASTAFPMWDIETAFTRHIKSKKVVMFADACHSAGIVGDIAMRSIYKKNNMVNKYLLEMAKAKKGRIIFTGSEAGEFSQESRKWGGGHGVFTYFLLNGMRGEADVNDDSIVTLGEIIDFVNKNVRRATKNTQHPDTAGVFDRGFPMVFLKP
jgi:uncharacterized caspase-like protein